jgi:hypothetical protein
MNNIIKILEKLIKEQPAIDQWDQGYVAGLWKAIYEIEIHDIKR